MGDPYQRGWTENFKWEAVRLLLTSGRTVGEAALARAQAESGMISTEAAEAITAAASLDLLDRARIDEGFVRTTHTLVPLVWELSRVVGEPHGG